MHTTERRIVSLCDAAFVAAFGSVLGLSASGAARAAGICLMALAALCAMPITIETALRAVLRLPGHVPGKEGPDAGT